MRTFLEFLLAYTLKMALSLRYSITVKGLDQLKANLKRPGGILFLPNHPAAFVDATSIIIALWPTYRLRPMIVEYMYNLPIVNQVMRFLHALPVPDFSTSSNSFKRKKNEKVTQEVIQGLRRKENFLIFPSGRCKHTAYEALDGASAVNRIVNEVSEANIVLVRIKGLWGSSFSRAFTNYTPPFFPTLFQNIKHLFKNFIFFMPRRKVIIEFELASDELRDQKTRLEFNQYLESWYNKPDGLSQQEGSTPGDSLVLISYSCWKEELPTVAQGNKPLIEEEESIAVSEEIKTTVISKIAQLTTRDPSDIKPEMMLTTDLGMDSLDVAEMIAFLQEQFDITGISAENMTTVSRVMAIASGLALSEEKVLEEHRDFSKWNDPRPEKRSDLPEGNTIAEVFLRNCDRMDNLAALGDDRGGIITFSQLKLRALILAQYLKTCPGKYIGIMLPASSTATLCILACQLAGKVPLMVNWTVGTRHLQAVSQLSGIKVVLTSWSFLDRLQNVDLTGIEDQLVMLEEVRGKISLVDKLKAFLLSKWNAKVILRALDLHLQSENDEAVLLFTSGTENMPKGVPLSHKNILSNQRAALQAVEVFSSDVILGILPPFHSFGFTISSLLGPLSTFRVAYSPDPTNGKRLADSCQKWSATIMVGAPTFIKGIVKSAQPEQLKTIRLCITGAEKLPPDLVQSFALLGMADRLLEGYGITECAPVLTFTPLGKPRRGVGQPLPGIELLIVDLDSHFPVATGVQGLILARGPNVFEGYLNNDQHSPFITLGDKKWYNTGDLGYLDHDGNLILTGRLKRFIKIGGEMISLAAIEEALSEQALQKNWWREVAETPLLAVIAKELPEEKPKLVLYSLFSVPLEEINRALKEAGFSNLVKINTLIQLNEIPLMGTGKINYRKLGQ